MAEGTRTPIFARGLTPRLRAARMVLDAAGVRRRLAHGRGASFQLSGRDGFTMIELIVTSLAALTVLGAAMGLVVSSMGVQARDSEYALTLEEDRAGLGRIVREIRQATEIKEAKAGAIYFLATIGGTEWQIKYECTVAQTGTAYYECVRLAAEKGKALPASGPPVAKDLLNGSEVFTYSPSSEPSKVRLAAVKLEIPAKGTLKQAASVGYAHHVVLEDAAYIRALFPEG